MTGTSANNEYMTPKTKTTGHKIRKYSLVSKELVLNSVTNKGSVKKKKNV
jgi:hypothetical protein